MILLFKKRDKVRLKYHAEVTGTVLGSKIYGDLIMYLILYDDPNDHAEWMDEKLLTTI